MEPHFPGKTGTNVDLGSIRLEGRKGVRATPPRCRRTFGSCQVQVTASPTVVTVTSVT